MINTYPVAWQDHYRKHDYLSDDPLVHHGLSSLKPTLWTESLFSQTRALWEEARGFGLSFGWSQSSKNEQGALGMFSVCRSSKPISKNELTEIEPRLVWLTQFVHLGISRPIMAKAMPDTHLTNREIEVLRWTADGKTSAEVAEILQLTERTVNFHINNAAIKLSACNKTAATMRAAMLGLLF